jgi:hypothetical protein
MKDNNENTAKMNKNDLVVAVNMLSGVCSSPFWNAVYAKCENPESLIALKDSLAFLHEYGKDVTAIEVIVAIHDMVNLVYPPEMPMMAESSETAELFLMEFLADADDIIDEYGGVDIDSAIDSDL